MGRILVGVHRTAAASQALKWAAGTAARQEALLHVVTVITPGLAVSGYESYLATLPDALLDASRRQAAFIENVVGVQPDVRVRREIVVGTAVDRLVALSEGADLLVVGKRSRSWAGIHWPHTARGCVRASRCPVVIVHERDGVLLPEPVGSVPLLCARPSERMERRSEALEGVSTSRSPMPAPPTGAHRRDAAAVVGVAGRRSLVWKGSSDDFHNRGRSQRRELGCRAMGRRTGK